MRKVLELLFPPTCLLCAAAESDLCISCRRRINVRRYRGQIDGIDFSAGAIYDDDISQLILMAKEQNISAARNVLADLLVEAYMELVSQDKSAHPLGLIPIPSSQRANRMRGYKHSTLLSQRLRNQLIQTLGVDVQVLDLLRVNRKISDQSGLNKKARIANLDGAYSYSRGGDGALVAGRNLYLVDDLLTTGSSMLEALRCLRAANIKPLGAISAGVSPHLIS